MSNKYNEKMKDSFNSYIRIKSFKKLIEKLDHDNNYMIDVEFFNDLIANDITPYEIELYVNEYMQYKPTIHKIDRKIVEQSFKVVKYLSASTKSKTFEKSEYLNFDDIKEAFSDKFESYKKRFNENFSKDEFYKILTAAKCDYCGISIDQIEILREKNKIFSKSGRGFSLEIDRIEPNLEYTKTNCCIACYWCNNSKTDEFTKVEFEEIAKGIHNAWKQRLTDIDKKQNIVFPYEFYKK